MSETVSRVGQQYQKWPYPNISLFARVHREQLWQINFAWLASRCGQKNRVYPDTPKLWIAGCGTFQPYAFSQANPNAGILATDLSEISLNIAKRRCQFHGARNITFGRIDLSDPNQYPTELFDYIECYGVLMCLPDPAAALSLMADRLAPGGIIRLMVYPHYSRQRIFQIQKLASLLGLRYDNRKDPALLRKIMKKLPEAHPLRSTFFQYWDSRNLQGIVDAFLHASDRGFTGVELSTMIDDAGLDPAFCFHRPWGQPKEMAEKLKLGQHDPAFWLHYLDLWQNLNTNFTLCLTKKDPYTKASKPKKAPIRHPLFDLSNPALGLRHRGRLVRLALTGVKISSRTHDGALILSPKHMRNLLRGSGEDLPSSAREMLLDPGSTDAPVGSNNLLGPAFVSTAKNIQPNPHFCPRIGKKVPNPMYDHLFDAYVFDQQWNDSLSPKLPGLDQQIVKWEPHAHVLEDEKIRFGMTPFGTYESQKKDVERGIETFMQTKPAGFEDINLGDEPKKWREVREFLSSCGLGRSLSNDPVVLRQLWLLLFSYPDLLLDIQ